MVRLHRVAVPIGWLAISVVVPVGLRGQASATSASSAPPAASTRDFVSDAEVLGIIRQRVEEKRSAGIVVGLLEPDGKTRVVAYGDPGLARPALDASAGDLAAAAAAAAAAEKLLRPAAAARHTRAIVPILA